MVFFLCIFPLDFQLLCNFNWPQSLVSQHVVLALLHSPIRIMWMLCLRTGPIHWMAVQLIRNHAIRVHCKSRKKVAATRSFWVVYHRMWRKPIYAHSSDAMEKSPKLSSCTIKRRKNRVALDFYRLKMKDRLNVWPMNATSISMANKLKSRRPNHATVADIARWTPIQINGITIKEPH